MEGFIFLILLAFFVVAPIWWTINVMTSKGYGGAVSFFLGLFLGFIAVPIAYILPKKETE